MSPAGFGWPRPRKGGLGHLPARAIRRYGEARGRRCRLALLGEALDDVVGEPLNVPAAAAGERAQPVETLVEVACPRLDEAVGVEHQRAARLERELVLTARRVRPGAERRAARPVGEVGPTGAVEDERRQVTRAREHAGARLRVVHDVRQGREDQLGEVLVDLAQVGYRRAGGGGLEGVRAKAVADLADERCRRDAAPDSATALRS